ncbi:hypothetical protein ACL02S_21045 [Nocardia sp. 004]|uniref:hypothetical protein n=1 Tax=Nocardia sp. 004 TaxID=3385978 RepID=UPI0039A0A865
MTDIAPLAASTRAVFDDPGVHAVVRAGRTVHAVSFGQWVGEEVVPELLCGTGVAGWLPSALAPTRAEVTCARCLRRIGGPGASPHLLPLFDTDSSEDQIGF